MTTAHDPLLPGAVWQGLRVGVLGFGRSGQAAARLLQSMDCRVHVFEDRERDRVPERELDEAARYASASFGASSHRLGQLDALIVSPGVPRDNALLRIARESGVPVLGEVELAVRRLDNPIFAVTGTNGKSTTVSALHFVLENCGRRACLAGNIGTPLAELVGGIQPGDQVVLEMSSFQLETIATFHPSVAMLTNLAPDHLNRYQSVEEYAEAKRNMLRNATSEDFFVFGHGEAYGERWATATPARPLRFAAERGSELSASGSDGAYLRDDALWRRWNGREEKVVACVDVHLLGLHNLENLCAVIAALLPLELDAESVGRAIARFRGLRHRSELVLTHAGIRFVNDSKATNVHAAATCLRGMSGRLLALFGGSSKGEDFSPLREHCAAIRLAICYGQEGERIAAALEGAAPIERAPSLAAALEQSRAHFGEIDTLLLSPACASFDEFKGFEDRGDFFRRWCAALAGGGS